MLKKLRCKLFGHKWHYFGAGREAVGTQTPVVAVSFVCGECGEGRVHTEEVKNL